MTHQSSQSSGSELNKDKVLSPDLLENYISQKQDLANSFYSLFIYQERSHLTACINPHGGSTVTRGQFLMNRYKYDLGLQSIGAWLLGKQSLPDRRCLWVDISIPLSQTSAETTYPVLEQVWWSWYQWWNSRFPKY